jgi:hypothetical protein
MNTSVLFVASHGTPVRAVMALTPEQAEMTVTRYVRATCDACGVRGCKLWQRGGRLICDLCDGMNEAVTAGVGQ